MDVLLTGAGDFVGRALTAALRAAGHSVRRLGEEVPGTVDDESSVREAAAGCAAVVHLTRLEDPRASLAEAERTNLIATENVLAAARTAGVRRLVHLSSESVTRGTAPRSYVDERYPHPARFLDPATETRALAEDLVTAASGGGIETVVLRPGVIWGPDDDVFLPALLRRVAVGSFSWIDQGRALVATTAVDNLALAVGLALDGPGAAGGIFYLTDDERISRRDFTSQLLRAVGAPIPRGSESFGVAYARAWVAERLGARGPRTRAEVVAEGRSAHFNIQRARTVLGYAPRGSVAEGVAQVGAWVQSRGGWRACSEARPRR